MKCIVLTSVHLQKVRGFPALVEGALGYTHKIYKFVVSPKDGGFGRIQSRPRSYRMIVRKNVTMVLSAELSISIYGETMV